MSTTTTNYGLIKPDTTDPILIGQLNDNSDAIDAALKENADAIENKPDAADIPSPSTAAPAMNGTAAAGTSTDYARADHVHPSDTSKQDALTTAQLAAANSGIDSAKVAQIETNENNISSVANVGVKNLCKPNVSADSEVTYTVNADNSITVTCNTTAIRDVRIFTDLSGLTDGKDYILSGCSGGNYHNTYGFAVRTSSSVGKEFESDGETTFTKTAEMVKMDLIIRAGQNWTKTFYPMIRPAYISDPTYQPYAMSNVELTAQWSGKQVSKWATSFSVPNPSFGQGELIKLYVYGGKPTSLAMYLITSNTVVPLTSTTGISYTIQTNTSVDFTTTSTCLAYYEYIRFATS